MTTVAAFPHGDTGLFEHIVGLNILEQGTIALLMGLLNGSHAAELLSQSMEAFLVSFLGHTGVHICPLVAFALSGVLQILRSIAKLAQSFEPKLCMLFLIFGSL